MAIKTGRAEGVAQVTVDHEKCTGCGLCAKVCYGKPLSMEDGRVIIDQSKWFGCIGCGQCMAVCPQNCIFVEGRCLSPDDILPIPGKDKRAPYEELYSLMVARRSVRDFRDWEVKQEKIDLIIKAASTAPMGLPPSDVGVTVFKGQNNVQEFAEDIVKMLDKYWWLRSPLAIACMRPFMGRETYELMKTFVLPAANVFTNERQKGSDYLLYDAPLAMYFYASPYSDPADAFIAATYAMLAGESVGLGTCMIGSVGPFLKNNKELCAKYGIPPRSTMGLVVIFGFPKYRYSRSLKRTFAKVHYFRPERAV